MGRIKLRCANVSKSTVYTALKAYGRGKNRFDNKHLKPADNQLIKGIFKQILFYLGIPFSDTKYLSVSSYLFRQKMERHNFTSYYRVYKNDTTVTEVSTNDFIPLTTRHFKAGLVTGPPVDVLCSIPSYYFLPVGNAMYYGYATKIKAMEMAKAGAIKHINVMLKAGLSRNTELMQYRCDHYTDLNVTLREANINTLANKN